MKKTRPSFFL